jgi:RimJ/RimL family protein N-acetyltransferase
MAAGVPTLCDGHVLLDALTRADAAAHWAGEDDEQARRFGWYPQRSSLEQVEAYLAGIEANWRSGAARRAWAIRDPATRTLQGGCEVRLQGDGTAHLSWWVFPPFRRRGIASRAVRLVCDYAFHAFGVHRLEAFIAPDNLASRGVAHNAGFAEIETVQDGGQPMVRYVLSRPGGPASQVTAGPDAARTS